MIGQNSNLTPPCVLTIAGSDSGGGAGIQADIKTFSALGAYGASVLTSLTAQNTRKVTDIFDVSAQFVGAQLDAVLGDIKIVATKTGMLPSAEIVQVVAHKLKHYGMSKIVVDPVMVTTNGERLVADEAVHTIKKHLLPMAYLVTPNAHEAHILSGVQVNDFDSACVAARAIVKFGCQNVLLKGGHIGGAESVDVLFDGERFTQYASQRIDTKNTHGTGCTLAAALTAFLGHGDSLESAVQSSKDYITRAIATAFSVGSGAGPVNHFHNWWDTN